MEEQRVVEYMLSKRTMDVAKYISAAAGTGRKVPVLAREIDKEKVRNRGVCVKLFNII